MSLLEACTVQIKNSEFCADIGSMGATCFELLSDGHRDIVKSVWDKERFGMLCEKPEVFADLKAAIESLCQNTGNCSYEEKQKVNTFFAKIDAVKKKVKK